MLAIGLGVPEIMQNPTDKRVKNFLINSGYDLNPMKGVKGKYFTKNRLEDLYALCKEIINERNRNEQG